MKLRIVLSALVLNGVCAPLVAAFQPIQNQNQSRRLDRLWNPKHLRSTRPVNLAKNPYRRDSYTDTKGDEDSDEESSTESSGSGKGKGMSMEDFKVPKINFYNSVPSGFGVIGQGLVWLREISAALGTPLPLWIFSIPMVLLGVGLMFIPDFTQLSLPGFYPNGGGDDDPFAAFPPLFGVEGLKDLDFIKKATQLLPPKLLQMRRRGK